MSTETDSQLGRSPRAVVALMMAFMGAIFFFALLEQDLRNLSQVNWSDLPMGLVLGYVAAMAIGGALAGWLFAGFFGRTGVLGWALAAVGGVLAAVVAGLIGSAVGLSPELLRDGLQTADLIPIAFGLFLVPLAMAGKPLVAIAWLALVALTHVLAARARHPGR